MRLEYKVIPAPLRAGKTKGVKGAEAKFAFSIEAVLNEMAQDGWDFQRAETLPSEERAGLTSKTTVFRNLLVFRREVMDALDELKPRLLDAPSEATESQPTAPDDAQPKLEPTLSGAEASPDATEPTEPTEEPSPPERA